MHQELEFGSLSNRLNHSSSLCKISQIPRSSSERNELWRRSACPHVAFVDFLFLFLFFSRVVLLDSCDTRRNEIYIQITARPHRPHLLTLLLYLPSRALRQHLPTQSRHHAAGVCSPFYLILFSPLYDYTFSIHSLSLVPPRSSLLYKP